MESAVEEALEVRAGAGGAAEVGGQRARGPDGAAGRASGGSGAI